MRISRSPCPIPNQKYLKPADPKFVNVTDVTSFEQIDAKPTPPHRPGRVTQIEATDVQIIEEIDDEP